MKAKMNQDELYQYLLSHNVTIKRLGELIRQSDVAMTNAFKHHMVNGKPLYFSKEKIRRINEALPKMADDITSRLMRFNSDNNSSKTTRRYDSGCVEQLRRVGDYFSVKGLTSRVLGWTNSKKAAVFSKSNKLFGHISESDVTAINTELLSVAGVLRSIEIVPMNESNYIPVVEQETAETKQDKRKKRNGMEQSFESSSFPWDDTSLPLQERCRLFRKQFPGGVLLFRVNDGYTAEGDDARLVNEIDNSISPYTNVETGLVTAYMDSEKMSKVLPRLVAMDRRVNITNMYKE